MNFIFRHITRATVTMANACGKDPVPAVILVFFAYMFFNLAEGLVETLLFGERFEHFFDLIFMGFFIAWAGFTVHVCALLRTQGKEETHETNL